MQQEQYQLDHSLDEYINKMKDYGVEVNAKLTPALFSLKNGLKYPGLLTREEVNGYEELVKIPLSLVLTSHKAMKEVELTELFSDKFYKEGVTWQDRILVTYLLYIMSKDVKNVWKEMANQFSKEIDIVSFWSQIQLDYFVDKSVRKAAKKQRQHFEEEWRRFQELQQEYKVISDKKYFNKERYKWIYIHTVSRCFGSFLGSTYFVPFCELFNHNSVDVSYTCFDENKEKVKKKELEDEKGEEQKKEEEYEEQEDQRESVSSGYSDDYISDEDFDYMSINSYSIKWCSKISFQLKDKETNIITKTLKNIFQWIQQEFQLKGFTLIYLGHMIEQLKILQNQYMAGRQKFIFVQDKIQGVRLNLYAYRKYLVELYKTQGRQYQKIKNERGVSMSQGKNVSWQHFQKTKEESKQTYTHFRMEARDQAYFNKNNQIYFSYGKLSNRSLLVRYGFALEDNLYEHVWVKFNLGKQIQPFPDLFQLIQNKGLSINYKVKLKGFTFALEPVVYFRMCRWRATHDKLEDIFYVTDVGREIGCLEQVKEVYLQYLRDYEGESDNLEDKKIGYHQYFARVYNKSKKKILTFQLTLLQYLIGLLTKIQSKQISSKDIQIQKTHKKYLKHYLKGLKGLLSS